MKLILRQWTIVALLTLVVGCAVGSDPDADVISSSSPLASKEAACNKVPAGCTQAELDMLLLHTPLPAVPADTTNAVAEDPAARKLGQKLFFDPGFSGPLKVASDLGQVGDVGKVACSSCHSGPMFDDRRSIPRTVSLGADFHTRNAPALGTDLVRFPGAGKPKAAGAADGPWEAMAPDDQAIVNRVFVNYGKALAAYFRVLVSEDSPFDRFMAGKKSALSDEAQAGARLFVGKAKCSGCHSGPLFTGNGFHNLGVPQAGEKVPASDDGRFKDVPPLLASGMNVAGAFSDDPVAGAAKLAGLTNPMPESTRGAFRTPSLRGVAVTEPYMHS